ncbi:TetR/AcrR family transcriptional regulator [Undibacterium sp.]|uniref:TetR/AcrR family transcriptional regulator n=1 Tax=Undibacterium sp. TaxID=1914977 RepID=UPI002CA04EC8|nr:TetR family transcriptional regulator C-terminal domain-containing protein [Undibacterium sp.]HTD06389.1 TetR family transcriptional regulator C-terminal domain-containing protein [Undibacterium sp.]
MRDALLDAGLSVMLKQGYSGSGVRDIVAAASSPQGSFTNHFRSKEAFAVEVLARYFEHMKAWMESTLNNRSLSPLERIKSYLEMVSCKQQDSGWTRGCLIGNLSLETSAQSEELREQLSAIFAEWRRPFAECLREAQELGQIESDFPPEDLADFLIAGWQGAMLRMKVDRSPRPLEQFKSMAFATFLKGKQS